MLTKNKEFYLGIFLNYGSIIIGLVASLLLNPIIIKNLGQNEYGLYETIGAFVNYLAVLDLGFGAVVIRYVAKYQNHKDYQRRDEFLFLSKKVYQFLSFLILIAGLFLYLSLDQFFSKVLTTEDLVKAHHMFIFVIGTTIISIYSQVYIGALTGLERFILPRLIRIAKVVLAKITGIIIIFYGANAVEYTASIFIFECLALFFYALTFNKYASFKKHKIQIKEAKKIFIFSSFIFLQAIAAQLFWQADKLIIGANIGAASVAIFSVALNLFNIVQNISTSLKDILLPKATQIALINDNKILIQKFMVQGGRAVLFVYTIIYTIFLVLGKDFLTLWIGNEYLNAYQIFIIIGAFSAVPCALNIGETISRAHNKHQFLSYTAIIASFISFIISLIIINYYGVLGVITVNAIVLFFGLTLIPLLFYQKVFSINIFIYMYNLWNGLLPTLICVYFIGIHLNSIFNEVTWCNFIIKTALMLIFYIFLMLMIGFNNEEYIYIKKIYAFIHKKLFHSAIQENK